MAGPNPSKSDFKTVKCNRCGKKNEFFLPGNSVSLVCSSCRRLIDVNNQGKTLPGHFRRLPGGKSHIALGSFGEFNQKKFKVVGFLLRRTNDKYRWTWGEYLLFNPYYGYRWLIEDHGHWSFVKPMTELPTELSSNKVSYFGKKYPIYSRAETKVVYAEGEFYWRIKKDEKAWLTDYVNPPEILSRESQESEVNWSLCRYLSSEDVKAAFKGIHLDLPLPEGVAPHKPYRYRKDFIRQTYVALFSIFFLFCVQSSKVFDGPSSHVHREQKHWDVSTSKTQFVSKSFHLEGEVGLVSIELYSKVFDNWLLIEGGLLNLDTGKNYPFRVDSLYYSFGDKRRTKKILLTEIPEGDYELNYQAKSSNKNGSFYYSLRVDRNPQTWGDFWLAVFLIFFVWAGLAVSRGIHHYRRWKDSDFSPYGGSD